MKSPFPGMDPFIEGCGLWGDFHHSLICGISNALNEILRSVTSLESVNVAIPRSPNMAPLKSARYLLRFK